MCVLITCGQLSIRRVQSCPLLYLIPRAAEAHKAESTQGICHPNQSKGCVPQPSIPAKSTSTKCTWGKKASKPSAAAFGHYGLKPHRSRTLEGMYFFGGYPASHRCPAKPEA